jgi:hypothetical protein
MLSAKYRLSVCGLAVATVGRVRMPHPTLI